MLDGILKSGFFTMHHKTRVWDKGAKSLYTMCLIKRLDLLDPLTPHSFYIHVCLEWSL